MPQVYEIIEQGAGDVEVAIVVVELIGPVDGVAWGPDSTIVGAKQIDVQGPDDAEPGRWDADLDPNDLIEPAGTAWQVSRYLSPDDLKEERPHTVTAYRVPDEPGPVRLTHTHAVTAPGNVDLNAVEAHNSAPGAHDALQTAIGDVAADLVVEQTARADGDAATLTSANTYTDDAVTALAGTASEQGDTLGELEDTVTALDSRVGTAETALTQETSDRQASVGGLDSRITNLEQTGGGAQGDPGPAGDSTYQVWLDAGNSGTEQDFLDSLEGPQGPPGVQDTYAYRKVDGVWNKLPTAAEADSSKRFVSPTDPRDDIGDIAWLAYGDEWVEMPS